MRVQLRDLVKDVSKSAGKTVHKPEITTKQGRLKTDRRSKLKRIFVDDLASLERLTEDVIVEQLQQRYRAGQIYTYIGDILIAVNPFSEVNIYGEKVSPHGLGGGGQRSGKKSLARERGMGVGGEMGGLQESVCA